MTVRYELEGKTALVTGSTLGIGLATAKLLAESGVTVIVHGRKQEQCDQLAKGIRGARGLACDLAVPAARETFARQVHEAFAGKLDILVHNAGVYPQATLETQPLAQWQHVQALNVEACFHLTQLLLPDLRAGSDAALVIVSSVVVRMGRGDSPAYTTSKMAQIGLTRHLAAELGAHNIRVNCVLPGLVDTPGTRSVRKETASYENFARERQMLDLPIQALDVAQAIVFLCAPASRAITAACLDVNAGLEVGG